MSDELADAGAGRASIDDLAAAVEHPLWWLFGSVDRRHLPLFAVGVASRFVEAFLTLLPPLVVGMAIDTVFSPTGSTSVALLGDRLPPTRRGQLYVFTGVLLALALGSGLAAAVRGYATGLFSQRVHHDVRTDTYAVAQRLEMPFFDEQRNGEVVSVCTNDVNQLGDFLVDGIPSTLENLGIVLVASTFMLLLNWQLALVSVAIVPAVLVTSRLLARQVGQAHRRIRSTVGVLHALLQQGIGNVTVLKGNVASSQHASKVADASHDVYEAQWDLTKVRARHYPTMSLLSGATIVTTLGVGGYWVLYGPPPYFSGAMSAGALVSFLWYARKLVGPVSQLANVIDQFQKAGAAAARVAALRTVASESQEAVEREQTVDGEKTEGCDGGVGSASERGSTVDDATDVEGAVSFEAVDFAYPTRERTIQDVSFEVAPGETVGIVGPTGAGKSTLLKLLLGFYGADEGTVAVDGTDVDLLGTDAVREATGYVGQDTYLFPGTVRENVAYGAPDADDDAIREACRMAGAHEFVVGLPEGYDTEVGERGVQLSGGQRQRIGLARALVRDPRILLLDEALSHVDSETELAIKRRLGPVTEDRTTFVVAHRLATVRTADRILVLEEGRIVERGTHEELLDRDGLYATLWNVQMGNVDALDAELAAGSGD